MDSESNRADVFLSYARVDEAIIGTLEHDIGMVLPRIWRDTRFLRPTHSWWKEITHQIRKCPVFVAAISPAMVRSVVCQAELAYAAALGKPIVVVLLREVATLPRAIRDYHHVDYSRPATQKGAALVLALQTAADRARTWAMPDPPPVVEETPGLEIQALADMVSAYHDLSLDTVDDMLRSFKQMALDSDVGPIVIDALRRMLTAPNLPNSRHGEIKDFLKTLHSDGSSGTNDDRLDEVVELALVGGLTPILGLGMTDSLLGTKSEMAADWAELHDYAFARPAESGLPRVAQFINTMKGPLVLRKAYESYGHRRLTGRATPDDATLGQSLAEAWRTTSLVDDCDPYRVLARLDCPLYVTTHPTSLLTDALSDAGKKPEVDVCRWRGELEPKGAWPVSPWETDPTYIPSPGRPLVFHVFGQLEFERTLVLSEDDHFDFLVGVTRFANAVPTVVSERLTDSGLLLLGFDVEDWDARVLLRGILNQPGGARRRHNTHLAAQIDPSTAMNPARARAYLEKCLHTESGIQIEIFWGTAYQLAAGISHRLEAEQR